MMDRERQERDLEEGFDTTQSSLRAAAENALTLQERTLEFARRLMQASAQELRSEAKNNRATLEKLTEESRKHREAMEAPEARPER
jgi:hypothetical protein